MRALVTGVAGFVGSNLARQLLREGHEVVGIDVLTDYYEVSIKRGNLASIPQTGFTFVEADLNTVDLAALLADVDWIFHQAGQPGVRMSWGKDFAIYVRQNIEATQRLLEAAKDAPRLKRLVYASSSSIYGNAERYPTSEEDRPQPVSPYGVTKLAAEHLCSLYASNFGVPTVSLRYFTVYGPGQRTDMAFTRFVRAAVLDDLITIYGTGEQIRDFTFVDDVVAANIAAASTDVPPGTVLNVAGGSNVSVLDTLAILSAANGRPLRVEHTESVKGDVFRTGGDTTKITALLGWRPTVS
ncbi:MAG: NAD-dependent epimerase/dehydratase family protein, partial [Janthinobacterium lividum]